MCLSYLLLKFNLQNWLTNFSKKFKYEVLDLFKDFKDFFLLIKEHTYDVLCDKFGNGMVNFVGIAFIFLLIMLVSIKIINR